ncbi:MAG: SurA N-terminal domain-containing protein [Rhodobacteraceae bacterium]|nr:SurA N-terminal domain-containing protein [Paracoccaceae bacterium]
MTERKRSKGNKTFVWAVMGFLVIGMGGFGLSGAFLNTGGSAVATVGKQEISVDAFYSGLRQDLARASQQFNFNITLAQAQLFGIDRVTTQRLLTLAALDNEANNLNISVGDAAVRDELLATDAFSGAGGQFDQIAYDFVLQQQGLSRDEYDDIVRKGLTQSLIRQGVAVTGNANATATDTIMGYLGETRNFSWVRIAADNLPSPAAEATSTELQAFYDANPALFTEPESRDITYISLTADMLLDDIDVSDEDIATEYAARDAQYHTDPSIIVDRIVFGSAEDAQTALDQITAAETSFDIVAVNRGLNPADISLGTLTANQVSLEARDVLFGATEPGVYGPLTSSVGPALFRINAVRPAKDIQLDEVRDDIRDAIAQNMAARAVVAAYGDIDDLVAAGASLEEIADETDMQLFTVTLPAEDNAGLTAETLFIAEASSSEVDEERDVLESDDNGIFALRVDAINTAYVKPLIDTRDIAIAGQKVERTQELVMEHAETLQGLIAGDADFSATMAANALTANIVVGVSRNAPSSDLPPTVTQGVFDMGDGEAAVYGDVDGAYLVQITDVSAYVSGAESSVAITTQIEGQITQAVQADLLLYYSNALISETGFTINQPLIDAIISQNTGN